MASFHGNRPIVVLVLLMVSLMSQSQGLNSPESIVWDNNSGRYLISSTIDASILSVDRRGNISSSPSTAKGSHGLLLKDGVLYTCFRDEIHTYDVKSDVQLGSYKVQGAKFLNGICEDEKGYLYVTDFSARKIFRLQIGSRKGTIDRIKEWLNIEAIPNGIAFDKLRDELIVVTWGSKGMIYCIDRQTATVEYEVESGFGNLESIVVNEEGDAFVSCWTPSAILKFEQGVRTSPVLWKSEDVFRPTGLCFDEHGELVFVSAEADHIHGLSAKKHNSNHVELEAFPNPLSVNSLISYVTQEPGFVNITIYDCRGNLVQTLVTEEKKAGVHQFMYEREDRASGLYFINIQTEDSSQAIAVTLVD